MISLSCYEINDMWNGNIINMSKYKTVGKWQERYLVDVITTDNRFISTFRVCDNDAYMCIIDEMSSFFGLCKANTMRKNTKLYNYTYYSFMSGEKPYEHHNEEYDLECIKWRYYMSWWNLNVQDSWFYLRPYYDKYKVVCYPNRFSMETDIKAYFVKKFNEDPRYIVRWWLSCETVEDIQQLLCNARVHLDHTIQRINPNMIYAVNYFITNLQKFLHYYIH